MNKKFTKNYKPFLKNVGLHVLNLKNLKPNKNYYKTDSYVDQLYHFYIFV